MEKTGMIAFARFTLWGSSLRGFLATYEEMLVYIEEECQYIGLDDACRYEIWSNGTHYYLVRVQGGFTALERGRYYGIYQTR